eukprot:TRINITY_DN51563_c0_g1_i1.p2 TRINITY_DN51563_c0_g1~~TRINITY_DN51563_c0_g1_i1.p2  ORF type:complete len:219 (-),score=15.22 TRINITY_DN51563_c0_g1_i1:510-1166(-)
MARTRTPSIAGYCVGLLILLFVGLRLRVAHFCPGTSAEFSFDGSCPHDLIGPDFPFIALLTTSFVPQPTPWYASLLQYVVIVVSHAVDGYFHTFIVCWNTILVALVDLISLYLVFLSDLVHTLTAWPAVIVLAPTTVALLYVANDIIRTILRSIFRWRGSVARRSVRMARRNRAVRGIPALKPPPAPLDTDSETGSDSDATDVAPLADSHGRRLAAVL